MIAVIGVDLPRTHSSKYKKCRHLKLRISVIIKHTWVTTFAVQRVTYPFLKKKDTYITDYRGAYSKSQQWFFLFLTLIHLWLVNSLKEHHSKTESCGSKRSKLIPHYNQC